MGILDQLRPDGPLTTYESSAHRPVVRPGHVECRTSLLNACQASKELYYLFIPYFYRNSLVKNRSELFHFFRMLARRPDRRPMVRSFAWVGILRGEPVNPGSSAALLHEEATMIAERWNSIKYEWPCDRLDHDIAELSKYAALGLDYTTFFRPLLAKPVPAGFIPQARLLFDLVRPAVLFQYLLSPK